jgi:hypothetical protein
MRKKIHDSTQAIVADGRPMGGAKKINLIDRKKISRFAVKGSAGGDARPRTGGSCWKLLSGFCALVPRGAMCPRVSVC